MMMFGWIIILVIAYFIFVDKKDNIFNSNSNSNLNSSKEILNKRFVNGEIDEKTYLSMKKNLNE